MSSIQALQTRWAGLASREKALVIAASLLVGLAVLWWVAIAPALGTLRNAPAQHQTLDTQLARMRNLQAQAQSLQSQPRQSADESLKALEQTIRQRLGTTARYSIAGERVTVTLSGASAEALAQWLAQARINARALPGEARLNRTAAGLWDGTVVLTLPSR